MEAGVARAQALKENEAAGRVFRGPSCSLCSEGNCKLEKRRCHRCRGVENAPVRRLKGMTQKMGTARLFAFCEN